eukprot:6202842-Pleurochrysis_carterae.AAC.3
MDEYSKARNYERAHDNASALSCIGNIYPQMVHPCWFEGGTCDARCHGGARGVACALAPRNAARAHGSVGAYFSRATEVRRFLRAQIHDTSASYTLHSYMQPSTWGMTLPFPRHDRLAGDLEHEEA